MSVMSDKHQTLTDGVGACSKPMWWGSGGDAGFCDEPAYGKQERRQDIYVPALACPSHGGPREPRS